MIRDYELEYSENGIQIAKGERVTYSKDVQEQLKSKQILPNMFSDTLSLYQRIIEQNMIVANIVKRFAKIKGDMIVFENISRKKNKKYFNELEKFLNEYQR